MVIFKSFRQYTQVVNGIRFPNMSGDNFVITYFSENSSLIEDYPKLNIKPMDIKINVIPNTLIPRTRINPGIIKSFKKFGITSYPSTIKIPVNKNLFYDISNYLTAIDNTFNPSNYRQRLNRFIKQVVDNSFVDYKSFQKVLLYSIDLTKPFNKFIDRRFFPILDQLKNDQFEFDHLILCLVTTSGPRYRLLVKDKSFKLDKIITYLKSIREEDIEGGNIDSSEEEDTDSLVDRVIDKIKGTINPGNLLKVKDAVKSYLQKDSLTKEKIAANKVSNQGMQKVGAASILYKVTNDLIKAKKFTNIASKKKLVLVY